jgi:DNA-binding MarR family transcriptional regulator
VASEPVRDQVDLLVEFWCRENPGVDTATKTLAIRLRRAAHHLERALRRELAEHQMEMWELEVLLALRRAPEHRLSAGDLLRQSQVTSGAITNRVANLEERGWVRRDVDPKDRRAVLVSLTPSGLARAEQMLATKTTAEQRTFAGLDRATVERMSSDLRTLLVTLEGEADRRAEPWILDNCPEEAPPEPVPGRARRAPRAAAGTAT